MRTERWSELSNMPQAGLRGDPGSRGKGRNKEGEDGKDRRGKKDDAAED